MSVVAVDLHTLRDYREAKREKNRAFATALLIEAGIAFTSPNGGAHLVVATGSTVFDFWPHTGLFINRADKSRDRGVYRFIRLVKGKPWKSTNFAKSKSAHRVGTPSAPSSPPPAT